MHRDGRAASQRCGHFLSVAGEKKTMHPMTARAAHISACVIATLVLALGLAQVSAQTPRYPDRPIKIVVGFAAGGGTDVAARVIAQRLTEGLGQSVLVENRPGASGMIADEAVAKAPPDGYTLMMGTQTTLAVAPNLYRKINIDPAKSFAGVSMTGISPLALVVPPSSPARSVKDLIAMAKARPGALNFGSGGVGTTPHMAGELFALEAGIKIVHVAYRGEAPAINDLLGAQLDFMFSNLSATIGNIQAGTLRALAVTSAKRTPAAPEIPTVAETAIPGFDAATWFALVGPAGMPREVIARLNAEVKRQLDLPDTQRRFVELGMSAETSTPEALDVYVKSEVAKWSKVIKEAAIPAAD
jgi:tripartite-type tricarboxylate transporter receptor subunit TctC